MKKSAPAKSRTVENQIVPVSRPARVASNPNPPPVYAGMSGLSFPRRSSNYGIGRGAVWNGVLATPEKRAHAIEKAERLVSRLEQDGFPTLIRPLVPYHVSSVFWLGLPTYFCREHLPRTDTTLTMVDEKGEEFPTIYLPRRSGLSGGWRGFAIEKGLNDGDAVVFQLTSPSVLKVYIIRASDQEENDQEENVQEENDQEENDQEITEVKTLLKVSIAISSSPFVTAAGCLELSNNLLPADGIYLTV